jgi:hypothetical protein
MASTLELLNAANLQYQRNPAQLVIAQASPQAIASGSLIAITWPAPTTDNYSGWSAGTPTRYTPKVAGTYLVIGSIVLATNVTGGRIAQLSKNGTAAYQSGAGNPGAFNAAMQATGTISFNGTTDYVELYVDQNSGSSLNTVVALTNMTATWIHA